MNKKLLGFLTAGTIAIGSLGMMQTASADTTSVEYDVDSTFTVIIPQRVELKSDSETTMSIKTVDRNLEPTDVKQISVTSGLDADGQIKLERNGSASDTLTSTFKADGTAVTLANPVVGEFSGYQAAETEVSEIEFGIPQGTKLAGGYATTLVFTVASK